VARKVQVDQHRKVGARAQPALALQCHEGRHGLGIGPGVEEAGDALAPHRGQGGARGRQIFRCGQGRQQAHRQLLRRVFQQASGRAARIADDFSAGRVRRVAPDARQRDGPRIELDRVAEGGAHEDRARRPQGVEQRRAGGHALRPHPLLEPVDHHQPAVGLFRLVAVEASLDARLEPRHSQAPVVQAAVEQAAAARLRMHVGVDQAGHQHAAMQVDDAGGLADQGAGTGIAADVDDAPGAHGQRLAHAVAGVDGVDEAVAVHQVRRRRARLCRNRGQHEDSEKEGPAHCRAKSRKTSRAALCPGAPVTPPPGWVPAPQVYSPGIGPR
jgi:hypothetical protein